MAEERDYRLYLDEKFKGINIKLDFIKEQTTKTNGRVNDLEAKTDKLEEDFISHPINCPQAGMIVELRDNMLESNIIRDERKINWTKVMAFVAITGLLVTMYFSIMNNKKSDVIITKQESLGVPVVTNKRGEFIALPDSTKIVFFPNDSIRYIIKKDK